jgi:hypothetical protein
MQRLACYANSHTHTNKEGRIIAPFLPLGESRRRMVVKEVGWRGVFCTFPASSVVLPTQDHTRTYIHTKTRAPHGHMCFHSAHTTLTHHATKNSDACMHTHTRTHAQGTLECPPRTHATHTPNANRTHMQDHAYARSRNAHTHDTNRTLHAHTHAHTHPTCARRTRTQVGGRGWC